MPGDGLHESVKILLSRFKHGDPTLWNAPDPAIDYAEWYREIAKQLGWARTSPDLICEQCDSFAAGGYVPSGGNQKLYLLRHHGAPIAAWATNPTAGRVAAHDPPSLGWDIDYFGVVLLSPQVLEQRIPVEDLLALGVSRGDLHLWIDRHEQPTLCELLFNTYP